MTRYLPGNEASWAIYHQIDGFKTKAKTPAYILEQANVFEKVKGYVKSLEIFQMNNKTISVFDFRMTRRIKPIEDGVIHPPRSSHRYM